MSKSDVLLPDNIRQFLEKETVCSLGVALPSGEVHVAPLLFWCDPRTLYVYMSTAQDSEKLTWHCEGHTTTQASVAIGTGKGLPYLLQMRGRLSLFDYQCDDSVDTAYMRIAHMLDDPRKIGNTMIVLKPTWVRYSDWDAFSVKRVVL